MQLDHLLCQLEQLLDFSIFLQEVHEPNGLKLMIIQHFKAKISFYNNYNNKFTCKPKYLIDFQIFFFFCFAIRTTVLLLPIAKKIVFFKAFIVCVFGYICVCLCVCGLIEMNYSLFSVHAWRESFNSANV